MWFDCEETEMQSCTNCKYGDRDLWDCKKCRLCLVSYLDSGKKYLLWEEEKRGKIYDLFIQWNTWLGKVASYCKSHLSIFKGWYSSHCKFRNKHGKD